MNPDSLEGFSHVGENGPEPVTLGVLIHGMSETDLMAAFEQVVAHWQTRQCTTSDDKIGRSVRWLHDKYGSLK